MRTYLRAAAVALVLGASVASLASAQAQTAPPPPSAADDFVAPGPLETAPAALAAALAGVTAPALAAHIGFLASPALEGRGLGSRGLDAAGEYVIAGLKLAGVPPPAENGYFQQVSIREIDGPGGEVVVERAAAGSRATRSFRSGVDCVLPRVAPGAVSAGVVFASYGIREPELGRDDYRGLDVRGKVVVVLAGVPPGERWQAKELVDRYDAEDADGRWAAKLETARRLGAAAVLAVERDPFPAGHHAAAPARFYLPFEETPGAPAPLVRVSRAVADAILGAGIETPQALPGVTVTVRTTGDERLLTSRNVVAVIAGADPALRGEAVVIGAHLDHLGMRGGVIHPGADDDASGAASVLEIAKAFAAAPRPPKRTVVVAFWTAEEEGELGSAYYVRHPLWPLGRTAAYLNLDMIGHPWLPEEIRKLVEGSRLPDAEAFLAKVTPADFVEPGLPPDAPAIEEALRRAAAFNGLALHLDRTDGRSGGSDYRSFARAGVPFVRFFGDFFPAYHEPGDTAAALDAAQVQRVARLALATAWLLANR